MIEITGYVTESRGGRGFTLKITDDKIEVDGSHPEVSKEVQIVIYSGVHPDSDYERFERIKDYERDRVNECVSISKQLKRGDRVKCCAFIVTETGNDYDGKTYTINNDINSRETYTKYSPLWLYPDPTLFGRLEIDTPETLKFRKRNHYTAVNRAKCEKITGDRWNGYRNRWWINKNPKITFPMRWWVKVRTTISNLWRRFTKQENLARTLIITNIISIIGNIILAWLLFLKKP